MRRSALRLVRCRPRAASIPVGIAGAVRRVSQLRTTSETRAIAILDRRNGVPVGSPVSLVAWVRSVRAQKQVVFLELNDGSTARNLQIVAEPSAVNELALLTTGASVRIEGTVVESPKPGQAVEILATRVSVIGPCAPTFPLQKKAHSAEFLRGMGHLRARTSAFAATMRIRSAVLQAIHAFFARRQFILVSTPLLTGNDCEGAGELFSVLPQADLQGLLKRGKPIPAGSVVGSSAPGAASSTEPPGTPLPPEARFFGRDAFLTVSGQLHLEAFAGGLGQVYTLGPTFRVSACLARSAGPSGFTFHVCAFAGRKFQHVAPCS